MDNTLILLQNLYKVLTANVKGYLLRYFSRNYSFFIGYRLNWKHLVTLN